MSAIPSPSLPCVRRVRGLWTQLVLSLAHWLLVLAAQASLWGNDFQRGLSAVESGDHDAAIAAFSQVLASDPSNVAALGNRGLSYLMKGDHQRALKDFDAAIRLRPEAHALWASRAKIHEELGEMKMAIADFTEAIRLSPRDASWYHGRGNALLRDKQYDAAIADCTTAIRLEPKHTLAFFNRGLAYLRKKSYANALDDFAEAARLEPQARGCVALTWQARVLASAPDPALRDGPKAVELATRACELTRWQRADAIACLAAAYAECGDFDRAIQYQEKAISVAADKDRERSRLEIFKARKPERL